MSETPNTNANAAYRGQVLELIYGQWLAKGAMTFAELRIADSMRGKSQTATEIASATGLDPTLLYRFLRMLTIVPNFLFEEESPDKKTTTFRLGPAGELMCSDDPCGLAHVAALQNCEAHWRVWSKLPQILKSGSQNGFVHAYGKGAFEYMEENPQYKQDFNNAMTGLSKNESGAVVDAYPNWEKFSRIADIGGGHGLFLSCLLKKIPHSTGIIVELEHVVKESEEQKSLQKLGVADRAKHVIGDAFKESGIPEGFDLYCMKRILHDWSDSECITILKNIHSKARAGTTVMVVDTVVPKPGQAHISKLVDTHMMCWGNGRERTEVEFHKIFCDAGWKLVAIHPVGLAGFGIIEGVKVHS